MLGVLELLWIDMMFFVIEKFFADFASREGLNGRRLLRLRVLLDVGFFFAKMTC